jgi:hypothetical protein
VRELLHGELTFSAVRELMDMGISIKYRLKIEGDKFQRKRAVEVGGETHEFEIEGEREKKYFGRSPAGPRRRR